MWFVSNCMIERFGGLVFFVPPGRFQKNRVCWVVPHDLEKNRNRRPWPASARTAFCDFCFFWSFRFVLVIKSNRGGSIWPARVWGFLHFGPAGGRLGHRVGAVVRANLNPGPSHTTAVPVCVVSRRWRFTCRAVAHRSVKPAIQPESQR